MNELLDHAREMRHFSTRAERRVWSWLRDRRLLGLKFRRQHIVGPYIVDFFCDELQIAIEADGRQHEAVWRWEYDSRRTFLLNAHGIEVIRLSNELILRDPCVAYEWLKSTLTRPSATLSRCGGRGE